MEGKIEDFFIPENEVKLTQELDYEGRAREYVRTAEAFSRSIYQSVYIIDYFRRRFLFVSPNSELLFGLKAEQMKELNYRFYLEYVPKDEQALLLEFNRVGFAFYHTLPVEERPDWYIQYDFHVVNGGQKILLNHKLTPLDVTSDGRIWLALCVLAPSSHTTPGHVELHRVGSPDFYEYSRTSRRWRKRTIPALTDAERTMVTLSIQGFTMAEIAERMNLSPDTIKKYRKQIFEKLDVRNIAEAIVAATNNRLI